MKKENLVESIKKTILYHEKIGIPGYSKGKELEDFLKTEVISVSRTVQKMPSKTVVLSSGQIEQTKNNSLKTTPKKNVSSLMEGIGRDISSCNSCELIKKRCFPIVGKIGSGVRLLIVGGWYGVKGLEDQNVSGVFGKEEDLMLSRMLKAINLPTEQAFITNVIKCAIPDSHQPKAENVQACSSFLNRQISAIQPEVICAMGIISVHTLLKSSQPLSRLRGQFHKYVAPDGSTIPLIPTYHPGYLLQNPEMKQATWADLQSLAKQMRLQA